MEILKRTRNLFRSCSTMKDLQCSPASATIAMHNVPRLTAIVSLSSLRVLPRLVRLKRALRAKSDDGSLEEDKSGFEHIRRLPSRASLAPQGLGELVQWTSTRRTTCGPGSMELALSFYKESGVRVYT